MHALIYMQAGQDVELSVAVRDGYGNAIINLPPGALRAVATGVDGATHFAAAEVDLHPGICCKSPEHRIWFIHLSRRAKELP